MCKQGTSTSGVKRQYMGCAGRVANGINTVHLSYVREKTGHALAGARQWIPEEQVSDPVKSLVTGLPLNLRFRTKGELAIDILGDAYADGLSFDFVCGDEVYGSCTALREFLEGRGQAYVLRVASSFRLSLAAGIVTGCADAVKKLLKGKRAWEVRSAGKGSKGERWYAWAWLATASSRHSLLVRRHLKTGELAFHYCFVPDGQLASKTRLIRAAGLRWPVEETFELGKGCFGLDQCQARLYTAILRHAVLVMAALAVCAVTADQIWGVKEVERQAHAFAAAFLMPAEDIRGELPDRADWPALFELKQKWQVSLAALLMRARTLGCMSENNYLTAVKAASARGWRRVEPVPLGKPEQPTCLGHLLATQAGRQSLDVLPHDVVDALITATTI
ncbi:MAG TPA: IS701 family transposase [Trebonia sp.]|nr:IS701 family transposase [Trebonia sp.]